ncbi:MAG: antibiotic biosynthesis monooxygenase [Pseudomonadota bacterium]
MYIAMNRFRVTEGNEEAFEQVWLNRESFLAQEPGFVAFHMLRGPARDGITLYASHTVWADEAAFLDWTRSQSFRDAHKGAGARKPLYDGPPQFEGFTAIQEIKA